jgi:nucleosome assembly protein 1-like 1
MLSSSEETVTSSEHSSISLDHDNQSVNISNNNYQQESYENESEKINSLKHLQLLYNDIECHYLKSVNDLEYAFHQQCSHLFEKRCAIINGKYEPNDDECRLRTDFIDSIETTMGTHDKSGIPSFWLQTLKQVSSIRSYFDGMSHIRARLSSVV